MCPRKIANEVEKIDMDVREDFSQYEQYEEKVIDP